MHQLHAGQLLIKSIMVIEIAAASPFSDNPPMLVLLKTLDLLPNCSAFNCFMTYILPISPQWFAASLYFVGVVSVGAEIGL